jgi:hypothetical protein
MMNSIKLKSHVDSDGLLHIQLPDVHDADVEVILIYQPIAPRSSGVGSLSRFYGCIQDETFIRHPQGEQPERESFV